MANWLYKLRIKDLLADEDEEFDFSAHSTKIGPPAATRVRNLMKHIANADTDKVGDLYMELDEIADTFESVPEADDPLETFNEAMALLYDSGDRWHRIWIE